METKIMETKPFVCLLEERIHRYDLLCHPFYKAWSAGKLTRDDLRHYAQDYYPHVEAFPGYLAQLGVRLEEGELRRAVLANMADEKGGEDSFVEPERSHSELWLDFVEGVGGSRIRNGGRLAGVRKLISWFHRVAGEGTPEEALAAFYAYESQVPRLAQEKDRVLRELYGADEKTRGYFTLHASPTCITPTCGELNSRNGLRRIRRRPKKHWRPPRKRPKRYGRAGRLRGASRWNRWRRSFK